MPTLLHDGEPKSPLFKWDVPEHYSTNAMRKKIMKKFVQTLQTVDYDWGGPYEDSVVIQAGFRISFCLWLPEPGPVRRVYEGRVGRWPEHGVPHEILACAQHLAET